MIRITQYCHSPTHHSWYENKKHETCPGGAKACRIRQITTGVCVSVCVCVCVCVVAGDYAGGRELVWNSGVGWLLMADGKHIIGIPELR